MQQVGDVLLQAQARNFFVARNNHALSKNILRSAQNILDEGLTMKVLQQLVAAKASTVARGHNNAAHGK